jgi:hypothetical protein
MKRFINFGSIEQFSTVAKNVKRKAQFVSYDEETKEVILDKDAKAPVITAIGTEKIHGTNAAVCYSHPDGLWVQSRKNIITPEKDNAGCAFQACANEIEWMRIIDDLINEYGIDCHKNIISVYFEWSGGNIQKKSALSGLDKRAMIFQHFKVSPIKPQDENDLNAIPAKWLETCYKTIKQAPEDDAKVWIDNTEKNIFNIMNFPTVSVTIDFNDAIMSQNTLIKLVEENEENSPVGQEFGIEGNILEGYVFTFEYKDEIYRWKTKGEAHSKGSGKVKTLKPVDEALENKKREFVNTYAATESRLQQMWTEIVHSVHNGDETLMEMRNMGDFLRLVVNDVIKEETPKMAEMGLEPKMVNSLISTVAREFFKSKLVEVL